uniref:Obscurin, cytoskeletal calmodulin and titin-interacting RhoGEF n=1 Tax=Pseudonaja textilis TaxID=8673 RepID=A0A670YWF7_PSETE
TAVFSVELEQKCEKFRWLKNKEELKPSSRVSISSADREYTMIIRDCQMEDGGEIVFVADECRTSTQFTVSGESDSPPAPPMCARMVKNKTETSVTLAWSLQKTDRPIPIDGYLIERKKLTGFTWLRCHQALVSQTEFTVNNMTEEADYQFRVSAVNKYGQSDYLEFPGVWHLVKTPMRNVEVAPGRDATFTVDLTTPSPGSWYINGNLKDLPGEGLFIWTLRLDTKWMVNQSVNQSMETPSSLRSPQSILSENAFLSCEVAQPTIEARWFKGGKLITPSKKFKIETEGKSRWLIIRQADRKDEGQYTCEADGQKLAFKVIVTGKNLNFPVEIFVNQKKVQKDIKAVASENVSLSCEVAQAKADVKWYKDGNKKFKVEAEGRSRRLIIQQVEKKDGGEYTCEADEAMEVFVNKEKVQKDIKVVASENASLSCEVAQAKTEVKWFKDGKLITSSKKFKVEAEGRSRCLVVQQVEEKDGGEYTCEADSQKLTFKITVAESVLPSNGNFGLSCDNKSRTVWVDYPVWIFLIFITLAIREMIK